jgi:hypothetical protein
MMDTQELTRQANARGEGFKADAGKPRWTLLPWGPLEEIVKVLTAGALKYAANNWMKVPDAQERYADALLRHVTARLNGERLDPESGHPHLAHAGCCLLFWMWFDRRDAG